MTATLSLDTTRHSGVGMGVAGVAAAALVLTATDDDGVVLCPIRRCTGGYCPGCGSTRAARHLVGGNVGHAWAHSPWVVLVAAQAIVVGIVLAWTDADVRRARARRIGLALAVPNAVLGVSIWVVRLVDGSIPAPW